MPDLQNIPENILCISSTDWFPIPTRKQQLMSRLPEKFNILYVNPPVTLLSPLKDSQARPKLTAFLRGTERVKENIQVYHPPPVLPFGNVCRWINRLNQWWLSLFIRRQLRKLKFSQPLVWTYLPGSVDLIKRLDCQALVYDCVDEHSEYQGFINKENVLAMERELIGAADVFFVTAPGLYDSKHQYNRHSFLIPNGADFDLFNQADREETPVAEEMKQIKSPVIGFVGVLQEWIDLGLLEKIARENREWSVVLVGPVGAGIDVDSLQQLSNVHFLGRKKPAELPSYLKAFDVCINPFRRSALTEKVSPLKFYEYLATGKPIVTVDMPAVREFADCVLVARDEAEFIAGIKQALANDPPAWKEKRLARGRECSWDHKAREIITIIDEKLGEINHDKKL